MKYVVANWKAYFTLSETRKWLESFIDQLQTRDFTKISEQSPFTVVICPPAPFLLPIKQRLIDYPFIHIGAQDSSTYPEGSYTGEITARSLSGIAEYTIIGHSERRTYQHEDETMIQNKILNLQKEHIKVIQCIRNPQDSISREAFACVYEPIDSIGNGNIASINHVLEVKKQLSLSPGQLFFYGGSVAPENCQEYLNHSEIDGVLVATVSRNPLAFAHILRTMIPAQKRKENKTNAPAKPIIAIVACPQPVFGKAAITFFVGDITGLINGFMVTTSGISVGEVTIVGDKLAEAVMGIAVTVIFKVEVGEIDGVIVAYARLAVGEIVSEGVID